MLEKLIVVRCEGPLCTSRLTLHTSDTLEAYRMLRQQGWTTHQWTMYGNSSEYCSEECKTRGLLSVEGNAVGN